MFSDASQDPMAKQMRFSNPEHQAAFAAIEGGKGFIDLDGLNSALQAVKVSVEAGKPHALFHRPFQASTCWWLAARFGSGGRLVLQQWLELLDYVQNLRSIFCQIDTDSSGAIEFGELARAFQLSGVNMAASIIAEVGKLFDVNNDGSLEFDEFVEMRLEWDAYIAAWDKHTGGAQTIAPQQLLEVLEEIKISLEPLGKMIASPAAAPPMFAGIFYASMFGAHKPFQTITCEKLIVRFGEGSPFLSFEQFCTMMIFLKEQKSVFCAVDINGDGELNHPELCQAFSRAGLNLPQELILQIGKSFDRDNSGGISFDEFVQMIVEWQEMAALQQSFAAAIDAQQLQAQLGQVRVLYQVIGGNIVASKPFSLETCRWLIAKFGTARAGERCARLLTYPEFLNLIHFVKDAAMIFSGFDTARQGVLPPLKIGEVLAAMGLQVSQDAMLNILSSYDKDNNGTFSFDEFLQLLLEVQLYDRCFSAREQNPSVLTPFNLANPTVGQMPVDAMSAAGSGLVTLDRSAFLSLVFAVPRSLHDLTQ